MVLLAVGSLHQEAYALAIQEALQSHSDRTPDVTAIHSVLRRLELKGYVQSSMGGATAERGGRRKRFFTITAAGRQVVDESMSIRMGLYHKLVLIQNP